MPAVCVGRAKSTRGWGDSEEETATAGTAAEHR